jgi:hypothetical protein
MRLRRRLKNLNDAISALDEILRRAKGDPLLALSRLSPAELQFVREEITSCVTSRRYYLENYHAIQTEQGEIKGMFPLWTHQEMIEDAIVRERERTGQSKVIVLKPRQSGGTEYANGVMCHCTFFTPQAYTLTVAQSAETAAHVQRKVNIAWDNLPWWLRPERMYHSKGEYLEFQRKDEIARQMNPGLGSVFVTTHAERDAGVAIGKTIRFFHGTEVSRWGNSEIYTADIEPSMNARDTLGIMESASLDDQGFFRNLWDESVEDPESDWIPVFLPAYRAKKFSWPLKLNEKFQRTEVEQAAYDRVLREENFRITDEFFNWRRRRVKSSIKRTGGPHAHYAAYPMTPKEAFQSSGNGAFPRHKLDLQEQQFVRRPKWIGEVYFQGQRIAPRLPVEEVQPGQLLLKRELPGSSRFHIWELYQPGEKYYIGADTALGREGGDNSACVVWKVGRGREPDTTVADWNGKLPPTEWAKTLYAIGQLYDMAEIACEYAAEGMTTANALMNDLDYPNLYRPRQRDKVGGNQLMHYLHWITTMKTKPLIVAQMVEALLDDSVEIYSQLLLDEMRKYVVTSVSATGYTSYAGGDGHDDHCMGAMIGLFCLRETMPEFRNSEHSLDPSARSPTHTAKMGQGAVYAIFDEWTRMRGQEKDIVKAQLICKKNPGWTIKPILVTRANTAYSLIHHGRGVENQMWRGGMDSKEILPASIHAWKGARVDVESSEVDGFDEMVLGGEWQQQD